MRKREFVQKFRIFIDIGVWYYSFFSKKTLQRMFDNSKYILGYKGFYKRYCIVKNLAQTCGANVVIYDNVIMNNIDKMEIGDNVAVNTGTYIEACAGVRIGDDVSIAHGVSILTTNHRFDSIDKPHTEQGYEKGSVIINDDVWVGCKTTVLMNVEIGEGCVIGAGSVVTKDTLPYSVYVGVPARIMRMRK